MRKHKLLAVLLAFVMTLSLLPTAALADETAPTEVSSYETLVAALNEGKDVILTDNITTSGSIGVSEKTVSIDLNQKTMTVNQGNDFDNANVTISNGNLCITGASVTGNAIFCLGLSNPVHMTLNNVNVTGDGYSSAYAVFYLNIAGSVLDINGGSVNVNNDTHASGGVFKGVSEKSDGTINITGTADDPVELTFSNAKIGFLDGTVNMNYVDLRITGGANAINQSAMTIQNSTLTITDCDGRALTPKHGNITVTNSSLNFSGASEGEIRFKSDVELNLDANSTLKKCTIYADSSVTGAKVNGISVIGTESEKSTIKVENGIAAIVPANAVAEVNGTYYATLDDAVSAADGKTVTLRQNVTEDVTIPAGTTLTLDLNGKTLTNASSHTITNNGTLTITDTSPEESGKVVNGSASKSALQNESGATAIIKGGTLEKNLNVDSKDYYVITNHGAKVTIDGGKIISASTHSSAIENGWYTPAQNIGKASSTMEINGGEVSNTGVTANGGLYTLKNDDYGIMVVNGGMFTNTVPDAGTVLNWNDLTINGGIFSATGAAVRTLRVGSEAYEKGTTLIKDGTFTGTIDTLAGYDSTISITGGTFSSEPADVASGYHAVEVEGKFTVHKIIAEEHAAVTATCTVPGNVDYFTCSGCGADVYYSDASCTTKLDKVAIDALGHAFADGWTTDETYHWHDCSRCDAVSGKAAHTFGEKPDIVDGKYKWTCGDCGYKKTTAANAHTINTTEVTNGTVAPEPNPATVGQSVKLTLTPKDGYSDTDVQLYYSYNDVEKEELSGLTLTMPDADVTITGTFKPIEYQITYDLDGGTQSASNPNPTKYTVESDAITLTAPTRSGYTFLGWTYEGQTTPSKNVTIPTGSIGDKTFTANWSYNGGSSGGGGGSSSGGSSTTTEKNPDGSTTTTTTDKTTGTVTEVTKDKDGTTTTVETKKDGTVTETVKTAEGVTGTVVTDKNGDVTEAKATVSTTAAKEAAKTGEAVTLPVEVPAVKTTEEAPALQVTVPKSTDSVKVEIPVEKVTPGTVAVIVNADGTEKIVSTSVVTENGVALTLDGNATVKIIDNSKSFTDVPADSVFYNEISSLSAREIMVGKTDDKFDLHSSVTLDQIANVAGRITGAVDVKDFGAGVAWGADNGLKTGGVAATRGDVLKALYIAAGSPVVEDTSILSIFNDSAAIPADMAAIAAWAAQNGILKGGLDGNANLGVNVTRGQACALAGRTMGTLD